MFKPIPFNVYKINRYRTGGDIDEWQALTTYPILCERYAIE